MRAAAALLSLPAGLATAEGSASQPLQVRVNGYTLLSLWPHMPVLEQGRVWVPVQGLARLSRAAGERPAEVQRRVQADQAAGQVRLTIASTTVELQAGTPYAGVARPDGRVERAGLSAPPRLEAGAAAGLGLPIRDLARLFGWQVRWDSKGHVVDLEGATLLPAATAQYTQQVFEGRLDPSVQVQALSVQAWNDFASARQGWMAEVLLRAVAPVQVNPPLSVTLMTETWTRGEAQLDLITPSRMQAPQGMDTRTEFDPCRPLAAGRWQCRFQQQYSDHPEPSYVLLRAVRGS